MSSDLEEQMRIARELQANRTPIRPARKQTRPGRRGSRIVSLSSGVPIINPDYRGCNDDGSALSSFMNRTTTAATRSPDQLTWSPSTRGARSPTMSSVPSRGGLSTSRWAEPMDGENGPAEMRRFETVPMDLDEQDISTSTRPTAFLRAATSKPTAESSMVKNPDVDDPVEKSILDDDGSLPLNLQAALTPTKAKKEIYLLKKNGGLTTSKWASD